MGISGRWDQVIGFFGLISKVFDNITTKSSGLSGGLCVCCLCGWLGFVSCAFVMTEVL